MTRAARGTARRGVGAAADGCAPRPSAAAQPVRRPGGDTAPARGADHGARVLGIGCQRADPRHELTLLVCDQPGCASWPGRPVCHTCPGCGYVEPRSGWIRPRTDAIAPTMRTPVNDRPPKRVAIYGQVVGLPWSRGEVVPARPRSCLGLDGIVTSFPSTGSVLRSGGVACRVFDDVAHVPRGHASAAQVRGHAPRHERTPLGAHGRRHRKTFCLPMHDLGESSLGRPTCASAQPMISASRSGCSRNAKWPLSGRTTGSSPSARAVRARSAGLDQSFSPYIRVRGALTAE